MAQQELFTVTNNTKVSPDHGDENSAAWTMSDTIAAGRSLVMFTNQNSATNFNEIGWQDASGAWSSYIAADANGWTLPTASETADGANGLMFHADPQVGAVPFSPDLNGDLVNTPDRFVSVVTLDTTLHLSDDIVLAITDTGGDNTAGMPTPWSRVDVVNSKPSGGSVDRPKMVVDPVDGTIWVYWVKTNNFANTILNVAWADTGGSHDASCPAGTVDVHWYFSWTADAKGGAPWIHAQFAAENGYPLCVPTLNPMPTHVYDNPLRPSFTINTAVTPHVCYVALPMVNAMNSHVGIDIFAASDHTTFTKVQSFGDEKLVNDEWMPTSRSRRRRRSRAKAGSGCSGWIPGPTSRQGGSPSGGRRAKTAAQRGARPRRSRRRPRGRRRTGQPAAGRATTSEWPQRRSRTCRAS